MALVGLEAWSLMVYGEGNECNENWCTSSTPATFASQYL